MKTYCVAQGTLLNALWSSKWKTNKQTKNIYIYIYM